MIPVECFYENFKAQFPQMNGLQPWEVLENLEDTLLQLLKTLNGEYVIEQAVARHRTATVEPGAVLKGIILLSEEVYVGANAYLRGPLYLGKGVKIGPGCEIKHSVIGDHSATAHFNYIGNSLIGQHVNFEAGAICANHYNERTDKRIWVKYHNRLFDTGTDKWGALIGDHSKIGANAVLSPGTILEKNSIVKRLELVEQLK